MDVDFEVVTKYNNQRKSSVLQAVHNSDSYNYGKSVFPSFGVMYIIRAINKPSICNLDPADKWVILIWIN
jgi:hypothetical protein